MPRLIAALDADILVPILAYDFLLTAFDLGLYEPIVSTEAIVEVERNLIADFPHLGPRHPPSAGRSNARGTRRQHH